jgi:hypothetical protein
MNCRYSLIGVEGNHDQAFLAKILENLLGFSNFKGEKSELNPNSLWLKRFIPNYPKKGNLYARLDMPSILNKDDCSVAIYVGEGGNLIQNIKDKLADIDYSTELAAFGIVADADKQAPSQVAETYHDGFKGLFPDFPIVLNPTGTVIQSSPKLGLYILPNNAKNGVLETILEACGKAVYPEYMERARTYISQFSQEDCKQLKWKPFDREKATIATIVSTLKPGKTNTVSIADNQWVSQQTAKLPEIQSLVTFLKELLDLTV